MLRIRKLSYILYFVGNLRKHTLSAAITERPNQIEQ